MKSRSFFRGLSLLMVLNFLVKPVWIFLIDRQVQNIVGNDVYGVYFALLNLSFVLFFLADAGLSNMVNRRLANREPVNFRQLLKVKMTLLGIYICACLAMAYVTHAPQWQIFFLIVTVQVLMSLFVFLRSIITANQFFSADAWFSVVDKILMIFLCAPFIYLPGFKSINLRLFLFFQIVSTTLAVGAGLFFILRNKLLQFHPAIEIKQIVRHVLPFAVIILLMSVHNRLDGFLLEQIHVDGPRQAGIYASAYRLLDAANMVGYLGASFLVPYIARNIREVAHIQRTVKRVRNGLIFLALPVVVFTFLFADRIQEILYHSNSHYHSMVIEFCLAALPAYYLIQVYGSLLTAAGLFKPFIFCLGVSVLINLLLNLSLIPFKGALGCCFAAIASQYVCAFCCMYAARRSDLHQKNGRTLVSKSLASASNAG